MGGTAADVRRAAGGSWGDSVPSDGLPVRRARLRGARAAGLLAPLLAIALLAPAARAGVSTVAYDQGRTDWMSAGSQLTAGHVASSGFGELFTRKVRGQVYAQPLDVHGVLVVATERNVVYGLSASTGKVLWQTSLSGPGGDPQPPWPSAGDNCDNIQPVVGVTSTPVYDARTNAVYVVDKTASGPDEPPADGDGESQFWAHAITVSGPRAGRELKGWPVRIQGSPNNNAPDGVPFDPFYQTQRSGLTLVQNHLYVAFSSSCDFGSFHGYIAEVQTADRTPGKARPRLGYLYTSEPDAMSGAGIWMAGDGPAVGPGPSLFVSTGNGMCASFQNCPVPPPGENASKAQSADMDDAVLRLAIAKNGALSLADYFSPSDSEQLSMNDTDLASGGDTLLPWRGPSGARTMLVAGGKDGRLWLLNAARLGGYHPATSTSPGANHVLGSYQTSGSFFSHPAAADLGRSGDWVWTVEQGSPLGGGGRLLAWRYQVVKGAPTLGLSGVANDPLTGAPALFGAESGSPVVTTNGDSAKGALLWTIREPDHPGVGAELQAWNALPDPSGRLDLKYWFPIGTSAKFALPTADGARVYLAGRDGIVRGFGPRRPHVSALVVRADGRLASGRLGASGWQLTAGNTPYAPAIVAVPKSDTTQTGTELVQIATGANHAVFVRDSTTGWTRLGAPADCYSGPGAAVTGSAPGTTSTTALETTVIIACRSASGAVLVTEAPLSASTGLPSATAWTDLGGSTTGRPAVVQFPKGFRVLATGPTGWVQTSLVTSANWSTAPLRCTGSPAAAMATNGPVITCSQPAARICLTRWTGTTWSPATCARSAGRSVAIAAGTAGTTVLYVTPHGRLYRWQPASGKAPARVSTPAARWVAATGD